MASPLVKELTSATFDAEVNADVPVLVDFWAPWCGPCRMLAPVIDQVADEVKDAAKICKVNIDEATDIAGKFGIMNIPTILVFKNGEVVQKMVGVQSKASLIAALS